MTCDVHDIRGAPVIIGAGLAGLMTALHLAPQPVVLLSRAPLGTDASSTLAQGGLAASLTRASVAAIAAIGVDLISVGWLTHSAPILDIGLEIPPDRNCNRHLN